MRSTLAILPTLLVAAYVTAPRRITVTGAVTTEAGAPIRGANVIIADHAVQVATDSSGRYVLRTRPLDDGEQVTMRVRAIGYAPESRIVRPPTGRDTIVLDVRMKADVNRLSEIVVTGSAGGEGVERMHMRVPAYTRRIEEGSRPVPRGAHAQSPADRDMNTEEYGVIVENPFRAVTENPLSTFSVDVDRAAYSNVRRFIREGQMPTAGAARIEELLNYFTYSYAEPSGAEPIAIHADVTDAPWKPGHQIVRIGLQAKRIPTASLPPANLVFLIDVSGSMGVENKLPLVKQGFRMLVDQLRPQDRVAIVVYAGSAGQVLAPTPASDKASIRAAIDRLEAGGSTAGGEGIRLAYDLAKQHYQRGANNRVILATDGDFNVGVSSTSALVRFVEARRNDGIFLTVLGFGMGNLKDDRMEQLADKGNGNYAYVDDSAEARKVFVSEFGGTLFTVAKDVKLQTEFNPEQVQAWRLIGYENRLLAKEDFNDDVKDAGDMGSGHTVTALYEIVPAGAALDVDVGSVPALRYQNASARRNRDRTRELLTVSIRYKDPDGAKSRLLRRSVDAGAGAATIDSRFTMSVAAYGMLLHRSTHVGAFDFADVIRLAKEGTGEDVGGLRAEFVKIVTATRELARREQVSRKR